MRALKLWNGRAISCWKHGAPEWAGAHRAYDGHVYIAAYSRADVRRLVQEYNGHDPGLTEVRDYWSAGTWGRAMDGITPSRGIWRTLGPSDKPLQIYDGTKPLTAARPADE